MVYLRELWHAAKWPLAIAAGLAAVVTLAVSLDSLVGGPPKPKRENIAWEVDRFATTTVGGRKVTCFTRGSHGGLSCVPENE